MASLNFIETRVGFTLLSIICFLLTFNSCKAQLSANMTAEETLVKTIFTGYTKTTRPEDVVEVDVTVSLKQIISLDEKNQIMTTSSYISQTWFDYRLAWTPSSNNNIEVVMVATKNLWLPDTFVLNTADTDGYFKINSDFSYASVLYTGQVYLMLPVTALKTRCTLNTKNYPFDKQACLLRLTSWSNPDNRVKYVVKSDVIDFSDYTPHPVWELYDTDLTAILGGDRVPFEDASNLEIEIKLYLKRKPLFYMMNCVFPGFILNCITLLTFFMALPGAMGLSMGGFLVFSVYSLRISTDIPVQSEFIPTITVYFIFSISLNLVAMIWFVIRHQFTTRSKLPGWFDKFCGYLKLVFCYCFPPEKKPDGDKKEKDVKKEKQNIPNIAQSSEKVEDITMPKLPGAINIEKVEEKEKAKADQLKCKFCDRCSNCNAEYKKDKDKAKNKKDVDSKLDAFNWLFFLVMLLVMFVGQLAIWLSIGS